MGARKTARKFWVPDRLPRAARHTGKFTGAVREDNCARNHKSGPVGLKPRDGSLLYPADGTKALFNDMATGQKKGPK